MLILLLLLVLLLLLHLACSSQDGNVLGGTFRLTFNGQTTASIANDASAYAMQTALESLSVIGGVQVVR